MKKEIIIGATAALLASIITYFTTTVDRKLTKVQLQEVANNIVNNDAFHAVLLSQFAEDSRFTPEDGLDGIRNVSESGTNWTADVGSSMQICWGYSDLSTDNSHTREFSFDFAKPFSEPPVVTNAINANSSGWAFSVYRSEITDESYSGRVIEHTSRKNMTPVRMSYIAIGRK